MTLISIFWYEILVTCSRKINFTKTRVTRRPNLNMNRLYVTPPVRSLAENGIFMATQPFLFFSTLVDALVWYEVLNFQLVGLQRQVSAIALDLHTRFWFRALLLETRSQTTIQWTTLWCHICGVAVSSGQSAITCYLIKASSTRFPFKWPTLRIKFHHDNTYLNHTTCVLHMSAWWHCFSVTSINCNRSLS